MSLLLAGLVFAGTGGALFVGRWIARRSEAAASGSEVEGGAKAPNGEAPEADEAQGRADVEREVPTPDDPSKRPAASASEEARTKRRRLPPKGDEVRLDGFVCQLGDVILRHTGEEAWLAGGLVLSEDLPIAVLFVAPDAGHDCAIYVRARPRDSIWWLEPLDPTAVLVGGAPPNAVEHQGIRFERARRLPLRPRRIGVGAVDVGDEVVIAEYSSAGAERLLVLKGTSGVVRAYRGEELADGSFEVIASGDSTLEP